MAWVLMIGCLVLIAWGLSIVLFPSAQVDRFRGEDQANNRASGTLKLMRRE